MRSSTERWESASWSQGLVLMGDINHADSFWEVYTARNTWSRGFLQRIDGDFLSQVSEEAMRRSRGSLGCSGHKVVEFRMVCERCWASRVTTLDFLRDNFGLFKELLGEIPWLRALKGGGVQHSWLIFKLHFLQARCISVSKKSRRLSLFPFVEE